MSEAAAPASTPNTTAPGEGAAPPAAPDTSLLGGTPAPAKAEGETAAPPTDAAPAAGQEAAPKDGEAQKPSEPEKPVEYTDFTMPEGVTLDKDALGRFVPIAQELKLGQEQAQKLVSLYAEQQKASAAAAAKAWSDQQKAWEGAARTDKEFGGDGLDANLAVAKQALDRFGTPELKAYLDDFGGGNHPEVIRFFYRIGKAVSDDTFHAGSAPGRATDPAHILFPNDAPKGN